MKSSFKTLVVSLCVTLLQSHNRTTAYNYVLICTGHNCSPCIKTADDFFSDKKISYTIINLYSNTAEKELTADLIKNFCSTSTPKKTRKVKDKYSFGKFIFTSDDPGPFVIKYSRADTVIYPAETMENIRSDNSIQQ